MDNLWKFMVGVKKLHEDAIIPTKAHHTDLGIDLYCLEDTVIIAGNVTKVRTGIACQFPYGVGALIRDRSSIATKQKIFVVAGVIDQDYTGEILVAFFNPGHLIFHEMCDFVTDKYTYKLEKSGNVTLTKGQKIAQMILTSTVQFPIREVTTLEETSRGTQGFGSSGK